MDDYTKSIIGIGSSPLSGTAIEVSLLKSLKIFPFLASMAALCLFVVPN